MQETAEKSNLKLWSIIGYSLLAVISGLTGFLFVAIVNKVIEQSITSGLPEENNLLLIFITVVLLFFLTRRLLSEGVINLSQDIYWNTRKDIIQLILKAPYRKVIKFKEEVYSSLTTDVSSITDASLTIINFFSSVILIIASLIYMAFLSWVLFIITLGVIGFGVLVYLISAKKGNRQFNTVRNLEQHFLGIFDSVLGGTKEIKVNPSKGFDIYERKLLPVVAEGKSNNVKAFVNYLNSQLISQILFYIFIAFILIYSVNSLGLSLSVTVNFVFVLLYLLGPIVNVMLAMPIMNRAVISYKKLKLLKKELDCNQRNLDSRFEHNKTVLTFSNLRFQNYTFYFGRDKFSVGPNSFVVNKSEVIFIFGGNGSGKTTFVNTLLNLYSIDSGEVYVDEQLVHSSEISKVKEMFSPVFSDFFLFDEFYGIKKPNFEKANYYIKVFELENKVTIKDGKFSTIDLSTGQRKRLALISALLENRPVLVLDEWAADQDPYFRKKFYTEIIPMIVEKEEKTIIAITHDDTYFHLADRLFKMEYGILEEVSKIKSSIKINSSLPAC